MIAFASSLDQIGPMTHSVEDAAIVLDAMSGYDPDGFDFFAAGSTRVFCEALAQAPGIFRSCRIGVPREYFVSGLHSEVEKSVREALGWYEKQGAKLVPSFASAFTRRVSRSTTSSP